MTDFSQTPVGGVLDAHDVDPIAEAEVYMAYGRHAQAEEILKDAIVKDGQRQVLKLKLLEIYQQTENIAAFESLASDVYQQWGPQDPAWQRVAQWGTQLDPKNPLYREVKASESAEVSSEAHALTAQTETQAKADVTALRFTPEQQVTAVEASSAEVAGAELETSVVSEPVEAGVLTPKSIDLPSLDFETASTAPLAAESPLNNTPAAPLAQGDAVFEQIPDLNFDLGNDTVATGFSMQELPASDTVSDEVDAKLDLIKAYIDMDDVVGAKELIGEVQREGSIAQRQRADALRALIP